MDYNTQKAKRMYELFLNGQPCKKVYAAVRKDDKYFVLKNAEGRKWKYQLPGGGVEDGEDNITAVKREIVEELNLNVKVIKSLGVINYKAKWTYNNNEFNVKYEAEVFLTEFISYANNKSFGLEGEFSVNKVIGVAEILEKEMLLNVSEFAEGGIKLS